MHTLIKEYLTYPIIFHNIYLRNNAYKQIKSSTISYNQQYRQNALIFIPSVKTENYNKFIFFIHGGGWNKGSPALFRFIGLHFASLGYVTAMPGYRHTPKFSYPDQVHDIMQAYCAVKQFLISKKIFYTKIIIAGKSAGAHLAALLLFHTKYRIQYNLNDESANAFISLSGPLQLDECKNNRIQRLINKFLINESQKIDANPAKHINGNYALPTLCIHGKKDPIIDYQATCSFVDIFRKHNVEKTELILETNLKHADCIYYALAGLPPLNNKLYTFLDGI
jgi:acetyl esterase/lipase